MTGHKTAAKSRWDGRCYVYDAQSALYFLNIDRIYKESCLLSIFVITGIFFMRYTK